MWWGVGEAEMIGGSTNSIEEDSLKLQGKKILGYSGILKGKQDALKFELDIRDEWISSSK